MGARSCAPGSRTTPTDPPAEAHQHPLPRIGRRRAPRFSPRRRDTCRPSIAPLRPDGACRRAPRHQSDSRIRGDVAPTRGRLRPAPHDPHRTELHRREARRSSRRGRGHGRRPRVRRSRSRVRRRHRRPIERVRSLVGMRATRYWRPSIPRSSASSNAHTIIPTPSRRPTTSASRSTMSSCECHAVITPP